MKSKIVFFLLFDLLCTTTQILESNFPRERSLKDFKPKERSTSYLRNKALQRKLKVQKQMDEYHELSDMIQASLNIDDSDLFSDDEPDRKLLFSGGDKMSLNFIVAPDQMGGIMNAQLAVNTLGAPGMLAAGGTNTIRGYKEGAEKPKVIVTRLKLPILII